MTQPTEATLRLDLRPEVITFIDRVRVQLADLDVEERQELTDGLEADLSDLVVEHGIEALGDPLAYARELRAAAGLDPVTGTVPGPRLPLSARVEHLLDSAHATWDRRLARLPRDPVEFLASIRPLWWALRAWLAVQLLTLGVGSWQHSAPVPSMMGSPVLGLLILLGAAAVSIQIGRGKVWPGSRLEAVGPRTLLVALNAFAIVVTPVVLANFPASGSYADAGYVGDPGVAGPGMVVNGDFVQNVYPYDAQGRPLTGVQLFDQNGRPLDVSRDPTYLDSDQYRVGYPWRNGSAKVYNVFPLPQRVQDQPTRSAGAFDEPDPPSIVPPLAAVPPASLPGIRASTFVPPRETDPAHPKSTRKQKASGQARSGR